MKLTQYCGKPASFYIQCKGNNSGQPLKSPIPNCFAVNSPEPFLFYTVQALFYGRRFYPFLKGSVIPYIRLADAYEVINEGLRTRNPSKVASLEKLHLVDEKINSLMEQIKLYKQLKVAVCLEAFK